MRVSYIGLITSGFHPEEEGSTPSTRSNSKSWSTIYFVARDMREYNREYYARNTEKRKQHVLKRQNGIRNKVWAYKVERGCSVCGYNKCPRALQFHHHNDDKEGDIGRWVGNGRSYENILVEMEKCVILCSNCHAEHHFAEDMAPSSMG